VTWFGQRLSRAISRWLHETTHSGNTPNSRGEADEERVLMKSRRPSRDTGGRERSTGARKEEPPKRDTDRGRICEQGCGLEARGYAKIACPDALIDLILPTNKSPKDLKLSRFQTEARLETFNSTV
jgi:hypothetical protein